MKFTPLFEATNIIEIIETLEEIESEATFINSSIERKRYLIATNSNRRAKFSNVPFCLNWKVLGKIVLGKYPSNLLLPICRSKSQASSILVKSNVLSFYDKENLICKFWRQRFYGEKTKKKISSEINAIKIAESINFINVPHIVFEKTENITDKSPYYWYKKIEKKEAPKNILAMNFLNTILEWYNYHGVNLSPVNIVYDNKLRNISFEKLLRYGYKHDEALLIFGAFEKIKTCDKLIPISWIHGDASAGNIIFDGQEYHIIDWENNKVHHIVRDVYNLINQGGDSVESKYIKWISNQLKNQAKILSHDVQMSIHELFELNNLLRYKKFYISTNKPKSAEVLLNNHKKKVVNASKIIADRL